MRRMLFSILLALFPYMILFAPIQAEFEFVFIKSQPVVNKSSSKNTDLTRAYVQKMVPYIIAENRRRTKEGLPSPPISISLAQAILESANGRSRLARDYNNHYGIKGNGTSMKTKEFLNGNWIITKEGFASYRSISHCVAAHSDFVTNNRYKHLTTSNDYRYWAKGLSKAGYATDPAYANLLITIIERYSLQKYDELQISYLWSGPTEPNLARIYDRIL